MPDFAARIDTFLAEFFHLHPLHATAAGMHDHDGHWPDVTDAGRRERVAFYDRWLAELGSLGDDALTSDERIDRDLIRGELEEARWVETELREDRWSPLDWVYLLGDGLFPLISREFAPLADRLESFAQRLDRLPAVLDGARESLVGTDGRPVARFHTEKAIDQWSGIAELIDDAIGQGEAAASDGDVAAVLPRLRATAEVARAALAAFETHLRDVVLPATDGEGRLGEAPFAAKMRHTMRSDELTPAVIRERAEREYTAVRAEMIRIARDIWPQWRPGEEPPADDGAAVRGVLDAIAVDHPDRGDILDFCRAELRRVEAFCRERDLIGLADEPLEIRWTPVFLRAFGGAMLNSPGPLDRGQKAFFSITPIPDDWSEEQAESYLREDNDRMLRLLTIHEAVPGHYLQGVYANRSRSIARAVFWSGVFAEGWAVYVTQVMIDAGFADDDPALLLTHWKFYLRAVTNAMIDVAIHTAGMSEDEAVSLMVDGGFQEEAEARNKYDRARLSSTQLSTYFVGSMEMWDLERERRRRLAAASGDPRGAAAVPEPRVVGGFGETPGFVYREHLEAVIGHGSPPIPLLRRLLLD
ncbi:MAG TPA: DUF885 domain-containing protein [Candidatus Limnocylindrales bacterium]|nr:DUF885 domain-containing protein [Candidatus Limnocylindrales bacterium]